MTPSPETPSPPLADARLADALIGTWHLVSWRIEGDGRARAPFGDDATGVLVYSACGTMSALITAAGRPPFSGSPRRGDDATRARAFDSAFAYAGRYHLAGDAEDAAHGLVVHDVTHALNPALVGTRQERSATLRRGDKGALELTLAAAEGARHHTLVWTRR